MAMPTQAQLKKGTAFAPHIIFEIHPPRSVWLWGAVPFFSGAGLLGEQRALSERSAAFFAKIPPNHHTLKNNIQNIDECPKITYDTY
ncbi:UNVERIFIED_CONTAM: hypothetical protein ABID98_000404 [Brevibacillus sp. OAP136]